MSLRRLARHLLTPLWLTRRRFGPQVLEAIEAAIRSVESTHGGEIRFVVESSLELGPLLAGRTPRQRAIELFARLGVWDTAGNNGVLLYLLMADHDVEIVADRGIAMQVAQEAWERICRDMESRFRDGRYAEGAVAGVRAAGALLARHFPHAGGDTDELPNQPLLL